MWQTDTGPNKLLLFTGLQFVANSATEGSQKAEQFKFLFIIQNKNMANRPL
jgi:hypothetical protein